MISVSLTDWAIDWFSDSAVFIVLLRITNADLFYHTPPLVVSSAGGNFTLFFCSVFYTSAPPEGPLTAVSPAPSLCCRSMLHPGESSGWRLSWWCNNNSLKVESLIIIHYTFVKLSEVLLTFLYLSTQYVWSKQNSCVPAQSWLWTWKTYKGASTSPKLFK